MSNYFKQVPNLEYVSRLPNAKISDYITVKNLFKRGNLADDIFQDLTIFTKYEIKGDDRPDNVANKVYQDPDLDWVILLSNNIINIQSEWPMPQRDFDRYLLDKYETYEKLNDIHHYENISNTPNVKYLGYIKKFPYADAMKHIKELALSHGCDSSESKIEK